MFLNSAGMFDIAKFKEFSNQIQQAQYLKDREKTQSLTQSIKFIIR
jgi:hypothetical protein